MASRSLLDGILTVRRKAFLDSSGELEPSRVTLTAEPEAPRRGREDTGGAASGLGLDVRALRERRVRRSGMVGEICAGMLSDGTDDLCGMTIVTFKRLQEGKE